MKDRESQQRNIEKIKFNTKDKLRLILKRHRPGATSGTTARTVLLLHGASASSDTFLEPKEHNLVDFLLAKNCEVWTLDWRSSCRVVEKQATAANKNYQLFTLDDAAQYDLPGALEQIQGKHGEKKPISVFAHCMGAGILSMAIGSGRISTHEIDHIVLSTLGLFYEASWDGWVKAEDRMLEKIRGEDQCCMFINSNTKREPWPDAMEGPYSRWPATWLPPKKPKIFQRLAFMFGRPYYDRITPPEIHNDSELSHQFGPMPLKLYMQCGQNVRRGFAGAFDAMDWTPERRNRRASRKPVETVASKYLNVKNFKGIRVTLITGERNQLWHPDSIHRMYDWLRRGLREKDCRKRIFEGYAHQDLVWGEHAHKEVYPTIAAGLGL